jgi:hypothetical protein
VQIRDRVDMEEVKKIYDAQVSQVFDPKLKLLGLRTDDISERVVTDGVTVWYTVGRITPELAAKGMKIGDRLLIFQSLRYTKESLTQAIAPVFPSYTLFDHGGPFIGALLKNDHG